MGKEIKQSLLEQLSEILKPKKAVDIMTDRLDKIHWNIGYPSEIDLNEVAENSQKELEIIPDYFLATMLNVAKSLTKDKFNVHGQLMKNSLWFIESELHFSINTYYDGNNIIVPAEFLLNPYYVKEFGVFNLATIGAILGHELAHSITEFLQPYDESKKCIVEHYNGFIFRDIGEAVNGDKSFSMHFYNNPN
jgi:predicted metalloendopeptidase